LGWTTYTPDFYLGEFDHWVEVKGWWQEDSWQKFSDFRERLGYSASFIMATAVLNGLLSSDVCTVLKDTIDPKHPDIFSRFASHLSHLLLLAGQTFS
jgi:hypothetical protein